MDKKDKSLAVLIDAENTKSVIMGDLLKEISKYGIANVRRVYADWASPHMKGWREVLLEHSLRSIDQPSYTRGKNSTDIAMVIDAMDLLYTNRFDGFCLVSSDSDFTALAFRIRDFGLDVYGFGAEKTPQPFRDACTQFVETDVLTATPAVKSGAQLIKDNKLVSLLCGAVDAVSDENGWALLSHVGANMIARMPEFDPRKYGHSKLIHLVRATGLFEIDDQDIRGALSIKKKA